LACDAPETSAEPKRKSFISVKTFLMAQTNAGGKCLLLSRVYIALVQYEAGNIINILLEHGKVFRRHDKHRNNPLGFYEHEREEQQK
jgi:hypothetical protein